MDASFIRLSKSVHVLVSFTRMSSLWECDRVYTCDYQDQDPTSTAFHASTLSIGQSTDNSKKQKRTA